MNKICSIFLAFIFIFFPLNANASPWTIYQQPDFDAPQGQISPLKKGEKAPFEGVLIDSAAAAKLMVNAQEAEYRCQIEIDKEVSKERAKLELNLENLRASRDALKKELDVRIDLKDEHIEFLEKEVVRNTKRASNGKWWLIGGLAAGIALTVGGAFIVREIRGNDTLVVNNSGTQ